MNESYTDQQLLSFLDEGLLPEQMSKIEAAMRSDKQLVQRLSQLLGQREAGMHSLGEIWRRHRLSCPNRMQLGSYLLGTLEDEWTQYIQFHVEQAQCRLCIANLEDLRAEQVQQESRSESAQGASLRRRKYFQSSAGYLRGHRD